MSSLAFHMEKIKGGNLYGLQKHNQRDADKYSNTFIDPERSNLNYDLVNTETVNYNKQVQQIIDKNYKSKRKIRDNTVKLTESIISSDSDFFKGLSDEQVKQFFEIAVEYFADRFGKSNIAYATVHLDETTPHIHLGIVPITDDGRLSAKELITPKTLREMHSQLTKELQEGGFSIDRGEDTKDRNVIHKSVEQFKIEKTKEIEQLQKELDSKVNTLKAELGDLSKVADEPNGRTLTGKTYYTVEQYEKLNAAYNVLKMNEPKLNKLQNENAELKDAVKQFSNGTKTLLTKVKGYEYALDKLTHGDKELQDKLIEEAKQKRTERVRGHKIKHVIDRGER